MSTDNALAYAAFAAARLGVPLTGEELRHAAGRAVSKQAELAPLYAALPGAPVEGTPVFRPGSPDGRNDSGIQIDG
jgi:hypothetical protein